MNVSNQLDRLSMEFSYGDRKDFGDGRAILLTLASKFRFRLQTNWAITIMPGCSVGGGFGCCVYHLQQTEAFHLVLGQRKRDLLSLPSLPSCRFDVLSCLIHHH